MKKILTSLAVVALLSITHVNAQENQLSPIVAELIKKNKLEQVDFDYVQKKIGMGNRGATESILIDSRPALKYERGTIPSSFNIPDTDFENGYKLIADLPKDKELIVYCGGYSCEKSPIVAQLLKDKGHKNVKE